MGTEGEVVTERRRWSDARYEAIVLSAARAWEAKQIMMYRAATEL